MSQSIAHKFANYEQLNLLSFTNAQDIGSLGLSQVSTSYNGSKAFLFFNVKSSTLTAGGVKFLIDGRDENGNNVSEQLEIVSGQDEYYTLNQYATLNKIKNIGTGNVTVNYVNLEIEISAVNPPGTIRLPQGVIEYAQKQGDGTMVLAQTAETFDPNGAPNQMLRFLIGSTTQHDVQLKIAYLDSSGASTSDTIILDPQVQTEYYWIPPVATQHITNVDSLADNNQTVSVERYDLIQDTTGQYNIKTISIADFDRYTTALGTNSPLQKSILKSAFQIHSFATSLYNPSANGTSAILFKTGMNDSVVSVSQISFVKVDGSTGTYAGLGLTYGSPFLNWWYDSVVSGELGVGSVNLVSGPAEGAVYLNLVEVVGTTPQPGNIGRWIRKISTNDYAMIMQETDTSFNCAQWLHIDNSTQFYDFVKHYIYEVGLAVNISKAVVGVDPDYEIVDLN